ncbi:MAG: choice-of-anchor D domain-containing protein [Acidobacteriaceae bacterium]|nr:choice-of-anchor D domain-containing protein [Acidobacteriaceae bacterium]
MQRWALALLLLAVPAVQGQQVPQNRAQAFLAGRQSAGTATAQNMMDARTLAQQSPRLTPLGGLSTTWQPVGPVQVASIAYGKITGRVTGIAIDPADASGNTIYIATTGGGAWKSVNAAGPAASVVFTPLTDTLPVFNGTAATASLSIGAISVQPGGSGVVLAGTGDPNDALDSYYGTGLLRSADGGLTWALIAGSHDGVTGNHSFVGEGFAGFAWSTTTPGLVVAAVSQAADAAIVNATTNGASVHGLFYSTDSGVTWQIATLSDGSQVVQSPLTSYSGWEGNAATAVVWNPMRQRFYAAVRGHGYYQSADGVNWTRLANQPGTGLTTVNCPANSGIPGSAACPIFHGALAVNAVTGDTFALTVDTNNLDQGVWQDACALNGSSCANGIGFGTHLASAALETSTSNTAIAQGGYNLALAAVPSGADTLLYAGTQDIFRCSLAAGCVWRNTTNTGNGCGTPASVAPAQHAIAALATSAQPLVYFGNDAGLWRSTDGVNQQGAACNATDASHFQNLNGALGSLAEVLHFSQSTVDGNTLIAGLGALGTAGTTAASTQSAWPQLFAGASGYNAIDPGNPLNWYISTGTGVRINLCALGGACVAMDFAAQPAISAAQTAGDAALLDAPFLLDPAMSSNLILGTCRVWRGPGSGGALWSTANLLSGFLDGLPEPQCIAANGMVRSLAAGGAVNGGSSAQHAGSDVLYAGFAGLLSGGGTNGGHLFATTAANTATSATTWTDLWNSPVTNDPANNRSANNAQFNPGKFDISSIAVDAHDATGATVYATVMGFSGNGVSEPHVYRSTDGGAHWANISSNLPNAPANSVVIDPDSANTVYVAMDTGVYATTAVSTCVTPTVNCWSILGTGLPNAPVTQLAAITGAAAGSVTGLLRAGTYGRGIWQIPLLTATTVQQTAPVIQLSASTLTFAAQQAQTASAAQSITVTNTGNAALIVSQLAVTGDFTETDNCTAAAIAPNANCTVQVTFLPSMAGTRSGTLVLYANVAGGQASVTLSGVGLAPAAITLTPSLLVFAGDTLIGTTSAAMNLTVTNTGGIATALAAPVLTGEFAVSNNTCGTSLAANSACAIAVAFMPVASGTRNGTLTLTDSAGTQIAALTGTGAAPATDAISPSALSFSAQTIGTTSAIQQVTLTNSGDVALTLISTAVTGDFTVVNGCGSSLIAHGSCAVSVAFVPRSTGVASGLLSIADVNRTQTVALSGTGVALGGVSLTPARMDFGRVGVGLTSAPQTLTLTNSSSSPLTIRAMSGGGDFVVNGTGNCFAVLAVNASCAMTVVFVPLGGGARTGMLTVTDDAVNSPQTANFSGMGVDFSFVASGSSTQTISGGGATAGYGVLLTPATGISGTAAITCSGAPANATCTVSPAAVDLGSTPTLIQVNLSTATKHSAPSPVIPLTVAAAPLLALLARRRRRGLMLAALLMVCVGLGGCLVGRLIPAGPTSATGGIPTPPGTYTFTVTALDSVSLAQHSASLTVVVQ